MPRVFPEMKETLQLSPSKRIGDWFLSESETIIRLYGFMHQPYILPSFFTTRIVSLEFFRQRLTVEEQHILNFRKSLDIKFPWEEGPYVVKSRAALLVISNLLRSMGISLGSYINYDSHQVISNREDYPSKTQGNISMYQDSER